MGHRNRTWPMSWWRCRTNQRTQVAAAQEGTEELMEPARKEDFARWPRELERTDAASGWAVRHASGRPLPPVRRGGANRDMAAASAWWSARAGFHVVKLLDKRQPACRATRSADPPPHPSAAVRRQLSESRPSSACRHPATGIAAGRPTLRSGAGVSQDGSARKAATWDGWGPACSCRSSRT